MLYTDDVTISGYTVGLYTVHSRFVVIDVL